jgi:hypothetical protein
MAGFVRRLMAWLHRHGPAGDDGARIIRKGDRGEPQPVGERAYGELRMADG